MTLSCHILVSTVQYDFWVVELTEVVEFADTEADEEDKKEATDNFRITLANKNMSGLSGQSFSLGQDDLSSQYSEVTTPPPQSFELIS